MIASASAEPSSRSAGIAPSYGRGERPSPVRGNLVPDAMLAALAIEHGLTLCSADTDFARFDGLRWEDPLRRA